MKAMEANEGDGEAESEGDDEDYGDEDKDESESNDGSGDNEKEEGVGEFGECASDFNPDSSCEGNWEETICTFEGLIFWCEDGVWLNEEDKE